jgi:hypothetical protein
MLIFHKDVETEHLSVHHMTTHSQRHIQVARITPLSGVANSNLAYVSQQLKFRGLSSEEIVWNKK